MIPNISELDVVILCGGLGTRLQSIIPDQPKILAKIRGTPFLDILLNKISQYKFKNIILCTGYLKENIKMYVKNHYSSDKYNIIFSEEKTPLGTGGALKNAKFLIKSDPFILMNGDSICDIDFNEFYNFHVKNNAVLSIVLSKSNETKDYGNVVINKDCVITKFNEKSNEENNEENNLSNSSLINAGIYLMKKEFFYRMPNYDKFSLEYDMLQKYRSYRYYGFVTDSKVIDIGTPDRYKKAQLSIKL